MEHSDAVALNFWKGVEHGCFEKAVAKVNILVEIVVFIKK
jgi:hypothetical protein